MAGCRNQIHLDLKGLEISEPKILVYTSIVQSIYENFQCTFAKDETCWETFP